MPPTPVPPPAGERFFARLRAFDIACPECDACAIVHGHVRTRRRHHTPQPAGGINRLSWSAATQRWTCPKCSRVFLLGLIAYPVVTGTALPPPDTIPSPSQARALRYLYPGGLLQPVWRKYVSGGKTPRLRNVVAQELPGDVQALERANKQAGAQRISGK